MMKLKELLKEGNVWERNDDGSLPTLADATKTHSKNLKEQDQQKRETMDKTIGTRKSANEIYKLDRVADDSSILNSISGDWFLTKPDGFEEDGVVILNIPSMNAHIEIPARAFATL